jgi:hypothetical protein
MAVVETRTISLPEIKETPKQVMEVPPRPWRIMASKEMIESGEVCMFAYRCYATGTTYTCIVPKDFSFDEKTCLEHPPEEGNNFSHFRYGPEIFGVLFDLNGEDINDKIVQEALMEKAEKLVEEGLQKRWNWDKDTNFF